MIAYVVLAALQVTASPNTALPPTPNAAPVAVASAKPNPDDKVVCDEDDTVGTRLGAHKTCHTRREWREIHNQERDALRHSQDAIGYQHN